MNLANNRRFSDKAQRESMDANPLLLDLDREVGKMYYEAMTLVGKYAYAGRDIALNKALNILGGKSLQEVHNHNNYDWKETHFGKDNDVVRKGATTAALGQLGFVGGIMADILDILQCIN